MTKKLFYDTPYSTNFTATVLSSEKHKDYYEITLDQTLFYPEGGGQPADIGTLTIGDTTIEIFDTHEKDDVITHYSNDTLPINQLVHGEINWDNRFDLMQNHTGEHMLSGIICSKYNVNNVGFHMGKERISLDFDGKIPDEDLHILELEVNKGIWANLPISINSYKGKELEAVNYRSKIPLEGYVRIVQADKYDCCACCGTHVAYTGEVGILKIVSSQNYKGGTRLEILCGMRALNHYSNCHSTVRNISTTFSATEDNAFKSVEKMISDNTSLQEKIKYMQLEYFRNKSDKIKQDLNSSANKQNILVIEKDLNGKDIGALSQILLEDLDVIVSIFSENKSDNYSFLMASNDTDVKNIFDELKGFYTCKGGGRPTSVQGSVECNSSQLKEFFASKDFLIFDVY